MVNKILVFDLFADFGQVKKVFTTMSPLSFPFLSRTALQGIIGAIIGIDKEINPENFIDEEMYIGLTLLNPVKKLVIPHNNIKVIAKRHFYDFDEHKPTNIEFLKDLKYRIYFTTNNDEIYLKIKFNLENHLSFYNISIGFSQCLANYEYIGEFNMELVFGNNFVEITSVCKKNGVEAIDFEDNDIFTVTLPVRMRNDREVIEYSEYIYEAYAKPLKLKLNNSYYKISNGENIVFL